MVQTCMVCYNNSNINKDVSYHHFPKDKTKRTMWLKALNLTSASRWQKVCSKHFTDKDFRFSHNCNFLQPTAVPIRDYKPIEEHNYARNVLSSPAYVRSSNIAVTSEVHESSPPPSISRTNNYEKENNITISHPFPFLQCTNVEVLPKEPQPEKNRIWSSSRIGNWREEDFSTPSKRRSNFRLVMNMVKKLRHKNTFLNQRYQLLQKKVTSLQDVIIKELKNK